MKRKGRFRKNKVRNLIWQQVSVTNLFLEKSTSYLVILVFLLKGYEPTNDSVSLSVGDGPCKISHFGWVGPLTYVKAQILKCYDN